jgi:uncharacterized membrane protein
MNARLAYLVDRLRESFWLVPAVMSVCLAALVPATAFLDRGAVAATFRDVLPVMLTVDNARPILSTVAGSMITVVSLVLSLTVVALTLASQQLGPRLVTLFVRDRVTQSVLGAFLGTFVYALLALALLGENTTATGATITVATAIVLALASFALLVAFIHHVAISIQADIVVARIATDLLTQIYTWLAPENGESVECEASAPPEGGRAVEALASGYVQSIDAASLVAIASRHEAVLTLAFRAGDFVYQREPLAWVHPQETDVGADAVREAFVLGPKRTPTEDIEYGLQAIVEVAVRALSPGVSDPFTALTCIDRLGDALSRVLRGRPPPRVHLGEDGAARVFLDAITLDGIFDAAFNQIRQAGANDVAVLIRLIETLTRLAAFARNDAQHLLLRRHGEILGRTATALQTDRSDRNDIIARLDDLEAALDGIAA